MILENGWAQGDHIRDLFAKLSHKIHLKPLQSSPALPVSLLRLSVVVVVGPASIVNIITILLVKLILKMVLALVELVLEISLIVNHVVLGHWCYILVHLWWLVQLL